MSLMVFWFVLRGGHTFIIIWELAKFRSLSLDMPFIVDCYRSLFIFTVAIITRAVSIFSSSYIEGEKYFVRFHLLVLMFVFSIFLLITSPSLISILLGWDGLGVTSYLLVVYFNSPKALNAGLLTALRNRVGDCLILIAIALLITEGG